MERESSRDTLQGVDTSKEYDDYPSLLLTRSLTATQSEQDTTGVHATKHFTRAAVLIQAFDSFNANPCQLRHGSSSSSALLFTTETEDHRESERREKVSNSSKTFSYENWRSSTDFGACAACFIIGTSNLWAFPHMWHNQGGAVVLIAYGIAVMFVGLPLLLLEICLGQYSGLGVFSIGECVPLMRGLSFLIFLHNIYIVMTHNNILAYGIRFLILSFKLPIPWLQDLHVNQSYENTSAYQYYQQYVTYSTTQEFKIQWDVYGSTCAGLLLTAIFIITDIKRVAKLYYFMLLYFIGVQFIQFAVVFRDGIIDGWRELFMTTDSNFLYSWDMWATTFNFVLRSMSVASGLTTLASYCKFKENFLTTTFVLIGIEALANFVMLFNTYGLFGVVRYQLKIRNFTLPGMTEGEDMFSYCLMPLAMKLFPIPMFWSIIYFFMVVCMGMSTYVLLTETVITSLCDFYPPLHRKKTHFTFAVVLLLCGISLPFSSTKGYIMSIDMSQYDYIATLVIALLEVVTIGHGYGSKRFIKDLDTIMTVKKQDETLDNSASETEDSGNNRSIFSTGTRIAWQLTRRYSWYMWTFITPSCLIILIFIIMMQGRSKEFQEKYSGSKYYFENRSVASVITASITCLILLFFGLPLLIDKKNGATVRIRFVRAVTPTKKWMPAWVRRSKKWKEETEYTFPPTLFSLCFNRSGESKVKQENVEIVVSNV